MKEKIKQGGIIAVVVIGLLVVLYGISWIVTCGIIKLITMCYRNMVDNLHFEEYFQRDSKKGLGARYVV